MSQELTQEQEEVITDFRAGAALAVNAVAGSGKTHTLVQAFQFAPQGSLAVAFNKRNAEDLQKKMPPHVICKTMNALGHGAWCRHLNKKRVQLEPNKLWGLWDTYEHARELKEDAKDIVKLCALAKHNGIGSGVFSAPQPDLEALADLALKHDIDEGIELAPHAAWLLEQSCRTAFDGLIDFDDQIYMPVMYHSPFTRFQCLAVDESQDLSLLQHKMVARSLASRGQMLCVGDRHQAIYAFRGADESSFESMILQFNLRELPLSYSFRCPEAVVLEAQKYVPHIKSGTDRKGTLIRGALWPQPTLGQAVLCRINAPLIPLAFQAIRKKVAVNYLGRDFMAGLKTLDEKYPTPAALQEWKISQLSKAKSPGAIDRIHDRYASLIVLHEESAATGISVKSVLIDLLSIPKAGAFTLSTVHRAKGQEWSHVTYLDYDTQWSGVQENNIRYVGVTRSMNTLVLQEGVNKRE